MTISERVAYIKGLVEGMDISVDTKQGKILNAILDVLEDMALEISDLNDNQLDIGDELDAISDDLADVEDFVFGPDYCDDECCCCDDDDDECCCCDEEEEDECCCEDEEADEEECCCDEEEEDSLFEVTCPLCNADIALTEADLVKGEIKCPSCGEMLEFEFDDEEE